MELSIPINFQAFTPCYAHFTENMEDINNENSMVSIHLSFCTVLCDLSFDNLCSRWFDTHNKYDKFALFYDLFCIGLKIALTVINKVLLRPTSIAIALVGDQNAPAMCGHATNIR